jgi:hypothetical protein
MSDHRTDLARHLDETVAALDAATHAADIRLTFEVARAVAAAATARLDGLTVRLVVEAVLGIWPNARAVVVSRTSSDDRFTVREVHNVDSRTPLAEGELEARIDSVTNYWRRSRSRPYSVRYTHQPTRTPSPGSST